ncbi:nitroreductase family deazaflavin-dependent oxidoreductase [Mycolicibacterium iranicum]|uniref:Nitroreductase n=1 Tax=Mycolicibacterium iranicum TaxID=912594 RepID=A0A178LZ26_MYCIR|nr:nitroreductase family deazaflavin-dependent oxidoreductase [Mycolicibacterium iranicum]OAN39884.1 nitroreductase [Mycolicibacterium iranicum]
MPNKTGHAVTDAVRQFNKHFLNPAMLRLAGRKHWYAAAIHHTGRTSGRKRVTPVVAERVTDGFIVPLPYGTEVDWLRNVIAENHATIDVGGSSFHVANPRIISTEAAAQQLSSRRSRAFTRFGITDYVKFDVQTDAETGTHSDDVEEDHGR